MRGLNRRIISLLNDARTHGFSHSSSCSATNTTADIIKTHGLVSCFHSVAFPNRISTLTALKDAAAPHKVPSFTSPLRFFSTKPLVAPKSSSNTSNTIPFKTNGGQNTGDCSTSWVRCLLAVPPLICAGLFKWQLERRQWKIDLLERRQRIMKGEPIDIFSDSIEYPEEYQRIIATGTLDHARTQYIGPRPRSRMGTTEVGYLAVTPLVYSEQQQTRSGRSSTNNIALNRNKTKHNDRREILVLRGWVPASWKSSSPSAASSGNLPCPPNAAMTTTVQGVVRFGEDPGTFVPDNKPEEGTWFYLNSEQLADAVGLPRGTPLIEVISDSEQVKMLETGPTVLDVLGGRGKLPPAPEEVYPLAKSEGDMGAFSVMPRDHLNYAATWFTLMAATGGMAIKALRKGKRG